MNLEQFRALARQYDLVPVSREVLFDTNTAVTAYAKIRDGAYSFLLESVIGGEKWARYTFLGSSPREVLRIKDGQVASWTPTNGWRNVVAPDPLRYLDERLLAVRVAPVPGLPRFFGGAVGYLAYDVVRHIERLPNAPPDDRNLPDAVLLFTDTLIAIDNVFGKAIIIVLAKGEGEGEGEGEAEKAYTSALQKIEEIIEQLGKPLALPPL